MQGSTGYNFSKLQKSHIYYKVFPTQLRTKDCRKITCITSQFLLWQTDLGQLPDAHTGALSLLHLNMTVGVGEEDNKDTQLRKRREEHIPITITGKTDLVWGK